MRKEYQSIEETIKGIAEGIDEHEIVCHTNEDTISLYRLDTEIVTARILLEIATSLKKIADNNPFGTW